MHGCCCSPSVVKGVRLDLGGSKKNLKNNAFVGFFILFYTFFLLSGWSRKCVHLLFAIN